VTSDFERDLPDDDREFREWCRQNNRADTSAMRSVASGYHHENGVDRHTILQEVVMLKDWYYDLVSETGSPAIGALFEQSVRWVEWLDKGVTSPFVAPWPEFMVECKIKVSRRVNTGTAALDHVRYLIDEYVNPAQGVEFMFGSARSITESRDL
jgi:hypothetical protein